MGECRSLGFSVALPRVEHFAPFARSARISANTRGRAGRARTQPRARRTRGANHGGQRNGGAQHAERATPAHAHAGRETRSARREKRSTRGAGEHAGRASEERTHAARDRGEAAGAENPPRRARALARVPLVLAFRVARHLYNLRWCASRVLYNLRLVDTGRELCYDGLMDGAGRITTCISIEDRLPQRRKVLSLRYMGYEVEEIAQILSISSGTVQAHINAAIAASADKERVNLVREAEMSKLEQLEDAFFPYAAGEAHDPEGGTIAPQASAAKVVLDVMDRRAKLMGIDKALPQASVTNMTLIQILSQIPAPASLAHTLEGETTPPSIFSRAGETING